MSSTILSSIQLAVVLLVFAGCAGDSGQSLSSSGATSRPDGELTGFSLGNPLPIKMHSAASVQIGSKVYLIGGTVDAGAGDFTSQKIYEASVSSDGEFNFSESAYQLDQARKNMALLKISNYVYVFGGTDAGGSAVNTIARAPADSSGLTGSFQVISETLSKPRSHASAVLTKDHVHLIGGQTDSENFTKEVERTTINASGDLQQNFQIVAQELVEDRWTHAAVVLGSNLYVIGGENLSGALDTIEKATVNADGTIGAFQNAGITLSEARNRLIVAALNGKMYIFGGWAAGDFLKNVDVADITNNELGSFTTHPTLELQHGVEDAVGLLLNNYFYVIGGQNSGVIQDYVQVSPIQK